MIPVWLLELIDKWIKEKTTGNIKINFFKGGIANIIESRSVKAPEDK